MNGVDISAVPLSLKSFSNGNHTGLMMIYARRTLWIFIAVAGVALVFAAHYASSNAASRDAERLTQNVQLLGDAERGDASAQFSLGLAYFNAKGGPDYVAAAMKWWNIAADQGNCDAKYSLGLVYGHGIGLPADYSESLKWFRRAAESGYALAQINLGWMYRSGKGVPKDNVTADMWFKVAVKTSIDDKRTSTRSLLASRYVELFMSPADIEAAERLAKAWKPTQAACGSSPAQRN
jgi:TPR repeat protein